MKSIAFISSNDFVPWGASEFSWSAAAERFVRSGAEVRVSVPAWPDPVRQVEQLRDRGCRIYLRRWPPPLSRRIVRQFFSRRDYVWSHMKRVGAGAELVVISQGENMDGLAWMEAAKSLGYPYAVIASGAPDHRFPEDSQAARLAACYEGARGAYFVSEANIELSRRQFGTPLTKAKVIRSPFNVSYQANPPWPASDSGGLSLACVGRLDVATKRQDLICEVLSLPRWRDRCVRVSFVGSGPNERVLRWLVEYRKLHNVHFAGSTDDIEKVWTQHHALLLSSRHEGGPLAVVEAMLCGRPCIATDVGAVRELIRDGINGFLAKAATVELLDETMNRAWENRHRLREMGQIAAKDVRQWESPDPTGDFIRELETLVGG
jgi:glycosyltransferase involved in cell wall biosynthesis